MNLRKTLALTALGSFAALSAQAANNVWNAQFTDNTNGVFCSALTAVVSGSTPPLPLNFQGSQVVETTSPISGTGIAFIPWVDIGGPIGISTTVANFKAALAASTAITTAGDGSATVITTNNLFHDLGFDISATAASIINIRACEFRQNRNTANQ